MYFVNNARSEKTAINSKMEKEMRDWNFFDTSIYAHFNATFWRRIEQTPNFAEDLKTLESKLNEIEQFCLDQNEEERNRKFNGLKIKGFLLSEEGKNSETCRLMVLPEMKLIDFVKKKQWPDSEE